MSLAAEQQMFRRMFRDFVAKEVARVAEQTDKREELPRELLQRAAAQGFLFADPKGFAEALLDALGS